MRIVIVDGSDPNHECAEYLRTIRSPLNSLIQTGKNIGHGVGMCMGIDEVRTPYALIFDSDIEMIKSPVSAMLEMFNSDTYGVGYIEKTALDGFEYGVKREHAGKPWMPYLHPYFQLISIEQYRKFHPYVHHGAPCYLAMRDIFNKGLSEKIIKEFPGLGHSGESGHTWTASPKEYVLHDIGGTRRMRREKKLPEIEGAWVRL